MTPPLGPGERLIGRYRLDVLLSEVNNARFWRATDTVLGRSVGVHIVSSEDPRAPALIGAARGSAQLNEPHLLRVLDCDDDGVNAWAIAEWGHGSSLDLLIEQRVLSPQRTAWLVHEVAGALVAAHAGGLAHGGLRPERILISEGGDVKVRGFMIDPAVHGWRSVEAIDSIETDVVNLAGLLYAGLVGRWPGTVPSSLPPPPEDVHGPLRPRQVRAGVPRILDAICERVLRREAHDHALPIESAHEILAVLADYLGDPASVAPRRLADMYVDPGHREPEASPFGEPRPGPVIGRIQGSDPAATQPSGPPHWDDEDDDTTREPFVDSLERPLFSTAARRSPDRAWADGAEPGSDEWLFGKASEAAARRPGRHGLPHQGIARRWTERRS